MVHGVRARALRSVVQIVLIAVGVLIASPCAQAQRVLGSNLNAVNDYSPQLPFLNLFLSSRSWFTQCDPDRDPGCSWQDAWDTGESNLLDLDTQGWIRSLPTPSASPRFTMAATFWDLPENFPAGRYVVLYDGAGTIEYGIAATKVQADSRAGRDVVVVKPSQGGLLLRIAATDPQGTGNYIRRIRVVREGDEARLASESFSSHFLKQLEPYSALRFMDWMQTNGSPSSTWGARPLSDDARYSSDRGVPLEVMVLLANTTGKTPWFNIPHRANDTYIRNFASTVKATLNPSLQVYVEYSNEIWNSGFPQGAWVEAQGEATWPASGESGFTKRMNWLGKRSAEMCDIFKEVFAGQESRVVCVIASQAANSWTGAESLNCPLWNGGPCRNHGIGALAIAPYFGDYIGQEENLSQALAWTGESDGGLASLFTELGDGGRLGGGPAGGALSQSFGWIEANKEVANSAGIPLVAYEGGQHLVGVGSEQNNSALTTLLTSANRDARMTALYRRYLEGWHSRGGSLFVHFSDIGSYTRYGSWGALETAGQLSSPKYNALVEYVGGVPHPSPTRHILQVSRSKGGRVADRSSAIACGTKCSANLTENTQVVLTASARPGFHFVRWRGACSHRTRRCTVTMSSAQSVTAFFRRRP